MDITHWPHLERDRLAAGGRVAVREDRGLPDQLRLRRRSRQEAERAGSKLLHRRHFSGMVTPRYGDTDIELRVALKPRGERLNARTVRPVRPG